ncbi:hypothetical protein [Kitasatospora sp. NPDC056181]|uniref:hypothetical protein n=1 Tax=Kitasatospora sp. NPDC056181 TaxID=3345737 RepID=UPI0035E192E6
MNVTLPPWAERAALRATGAALALAAAGPVDDPGGAVDRFGPAAAVIAGALAAAGAVPPVDPRHRPVGWPARLAAGRATVLPAGAVALAALGEPPFWQAAAVAVLLTGYLLLVDAFGSHRRTTGPAHGVAAVVASLLVLPVAFAPTGAGEWSRPVAVLGLVAAACGVGLAFWPHRGRRARE